jgi:hypothetical protein
MERLFFVVAVYGKIDRIERPVAKQLFESIALRKASPRVKDILSEARVPVILSAAKNLTDASTVSVILSAAKNLTDASTVSVILSAAKNLKIEHVGSFSVKLPGTRV